MEWPPFPGHRRRSGAGGGSMEFKLIQAAVNGDLRRFKRVAKMLDMGRGRLGKFVGEVRVEGVPQLEGIGVMHAAAASGSLAMCTYLVETLHLDVNDASDDGHCAIVKELLAKGAYVDPVSVYGTPLHIAALEGKDNTLKILLDHDADCNRVVNGKTPLLLAKRAASEKCVELLVEAGADDSMLTDFLGAAINGSAECLNSMLEEIDTNHHVPDDDKLVNESKIAELKSLASRAAQIKDYLSAAGFYSKAIDLDPDDATLLSNRSLCWLHMGDGGKALLDAQECRKKRPDWPKACYRQGTALMLLKDYQSACEALFDGLKLDPGNAEIEDALREAFKSLRISQST